MQEIFGGMINQKECLKVGVVLDHDLEAQAILKVEVVTSHQATVRVVQDIQKAIQVTLNRIQVTQNQIQGTLNRILGRQEGTLKRTLGRQLQILRRNPPPRTLGRHTKKPIQILTKKQTQTLTKKRTRDRHTLRNHHLDIRCRTLITKKAT